jgi:hypothetical protein
VADAAVGVEVVAQGVDCAIESQNWIYYLEVVLSVDDGGCPAEKNDYRDFVDFVVGDMPELGGVAEDAVAGGCCIPQKRIAVVAERIVVVAAAGIHEADLADYIDNAAVAARGVVAPAEEAVCRYFHEVERDFELETVVSG